MTQKGNYRKVMLEMVLITGMFAIVSVFLIRMYLSADRLQRRAVAVSTATIRCESILEEMKCYGMNRALLRLEKVTFDEDAGCYVIGFDRQWQQVTDSPEYEIVICLKEENGLMCGTVGACEAGENSYTTKDGLQFLQQRELCRLEAAVNP